MFGDKHVKVFRPNVNLFRCSWQHIVEEIEDMDEQRQLQPRLPRHNTWMPTICRHKPKGATSPTQTLVPSTLDVTTGPSAVML